MKTRKLPITAAAVATVAFALYWFAPSRPAVANGTSRATDAATPPASVVTDTPAAAAASASDTTDARASDWETRLQHIADRVGKVPKAELDLEIADLARDFPNEEIMAALNLQLLPGTDRMPVVNALCLLLFHRWVERAPAEAAQWLAQVPENKFNRAAYKYVAETWASTDLSGALAWWDKLPPGAARSIVQLAVATRAAEQNQPVTAIQLLSELPPGAERDRHLTYSVQRWGALEREKAAAWVGALPNPGLRAELLGRLARDRGVTDPANAAAFAVAAVPVGDNQDQAVATAVRYWSVRAPEQAAAWAEQLPEGRLRPIALESLTETWARANASRTAEWLGRLPAGASRDAAVGRFAATLAPSAPEQATRWAQTIQDDALRVRVLASVNAR